MPGVLIFVAIDVKHVFFYLFFCKFCQVFTYFDMFYHTGHQSTHFFYQLIVNVQEPASFVMSVCPVW